MKKKTALNLTNITFFFKKSNNSNKFVFSTSTKFTKLEALNFYKNLYLINIEKINSLTHQKYKKYKKLEITLKNKIKH